MCHCRSMLRRFDFGNLMVASILLGRRRGVEEYPNPTRERGTILQVPRLRIGLRLVVLTSPLA